MTGVLSKILLLILAGLFWFEAYWPWSVNQDLHGTERRWGTGTIAAVTGALGSTVRSSNYSDSSNVLLKINGITIPARADDLIRVDQKVWVTYRIGKSGKIYVQRVSQLVEKN